jgi:tetratricopeptide (TPR) repeat protein
VSKWFRLFQEAWLSRDADKLAAAEKHYQQVVRERPEASQAWHILAGIEQARGRVGEALPLIRKALSLDASAPAYHQTLGDLLRAQGDLQEACFAYEKSAQLAPDRFQTHLNLGCTMLEMEKPHQALICLRRAVDLARGDPAGTFAMAYCLEILGRLKEAETGYQEVLRLLPENPQATVALGRLRMKQGHVPEARRLFERVLNKYRNAQTADGMLSAEVSGQTGGQKASATHSLSLERFSGKSDADLYLDVCHYLAECGAQDESMAGYRNFLIGRPDALRVWVNLGNKFPRKLSAADANHMQQIASAADCPDEEQAGLLFALAKYFDTQGDCARAVEFAEQANARFQSILITKGKADDPAGYRHQAESYMALFSAEHFRQYPSLGMATGRPVFIVGMPRSGTSLVEQVLASHPQVFGAGELTYISAGLKQSVDKAGGMKAWRRRVGQGDRTLVQAAARVYLDQLAELDTAARRVTDKLPDNYLHLGWITTMFPNVRIIHCVRDMRDVGLSCWLNRLVNLSWSTDWTAIAERISQYRRLMAHWTSVLPQEILHVRYEDMVNDLERTARRMVEFCGLEWNEGCLQFYETPRAVNTASHQQVREPVYARSIGRWKPYEAILGSCLTDPA